LFIGKAYTEPFRQYPEKNRLESTSIPWGFVVLRNGCNGGKGGVLPPAPAVGTLKMLNM
jgi:hypothetical protein